MTAAGRPQLASSRRGMPEVVRRDEARRLQPRTTVGYAARDLAVRTGDPADGLHELPCTDPVPSTRESSPKNAAADLEVRDGDADVVEAVTCAMGSTSRCCRAVSTGGRIAGISTRGPRRGCSAVDLVAGGRACRRWWLVGGSELVETPRSRCARDCSASCGSASGCGRKAVTGTARFGLARCFPARGRWSLGVRWRGSTWFIPCTPAPRSRPVETPR